MPTIRPLHDQVIIRQIEPKMITAGGIHLPDTAKEKGRFTGRVVSVGPGYYTPEDVFVPTTLKPGDVVAYTLYDGDDVDVDGTTYRIASERDIPLVLE